MCMTKEVEIDLQCDHQVFSTRELRVLTRTRSHESSLATGAPPSLGAVDGHRRRAMLEDPCKWERG